MNHDVFSVASVLVTAASRLSVLCVLVLLKREIEERGFAGVATKNHVAPVAAIATVGAAELNIFFAAKGSAAGAAATGADLNFDRVDEFHGRGRSLTEEVDEVAGQLHFHALVEVSDEGIHRFAQTLVIRRAVCL